MSMLEYLEKRGGYATLELTSGKQAISDNFLSNTVKMFNGAEPKRVYFGKADSTQFDIVNYIWSGAQYREKFVTDEVAQRNGKEKRGGHVAGALIGSLIAPGVGTIIGGLHGTHKNSSSTAVGHSESHVEREEIDTTATMVLRNVSTGQQITIGFRCNTAIDAKIRNLIPGLTSERSVNQSRAKKAEITTKDSLEEIKKLKELLDLGAISQEEYDKKKKQLLNL